MATIVAAALFMILAPFGIYDASQLLEKRYNIPDFVTFLFAYVVFLALVAFLS